MQDQVWWTNGEIITETRLGFVRLFMPRNSNQAEAAKTLHLQTARCAHALYSHAPDMIDVLSELYRITVTHAPCPMHHLSLIHI